MSLEKIRELYESKKRLLDEAEVKVRFALHQTRQEADMEGAVLIRLYNMQGVMTDVAKDMDLLRVANDKPAAREHLAQTVKENLRKMHVIRHEAAVILEGVRQNKKRAYKNIQELQRDFKHIAAIRDKMDKHLA